jgi:hypothetical protein
LTVRQAAVTDADGRGLVISGAGRAKKPQLMADLGRRLWQQTLESHLDTLRAHPDEGRRRRSRVLLVTNSYQQGIDLCRGLTLGGADRGRICVAVPAPTSEARVSPLEIPQDVRTLPANRLRDFPTLTDADVLISPFSRVARGLNIVVESQSALDSIWVCVRPIRLIEEPSVLVAHTGAHARLRRDPSDEPAAELAERHLLAARHLEKINRANPAFSRLPVDVRTAVFADVFVDLIQLAGRARRGGTDTTLYLVDNAFHADGSAPGSSFGALFLNLRKLWAELGVLGTVTALYGTTLASFTDFAAPQSRRP